MKILFKKILYTLVLSVGLISVSSCADYLDVSDEIADNLSLEDVFENKGDRKSTRLNSSHNA